MHSKNSILDRVVKFFDLQIMLKFLTLLILVCVDYMLCRADVLVPKREDICHEVGSWPDNSLKITACFSRVTGYKWKPAKQPKHGTKPTKVNQ